MSSETPILSIPSHSEQKSYSPDTGRQTDRGVSFATSVRSEYESLKEFKRRASGLVIRVPVESLKKIAKMKGMSSLSRETQHFVGITTMHGPLRVYKGKSYARWFWMTAVIICLFLLNVQIGHLINLYLSKPVVSQVSFLLSEDGMTIPTITICNYNPVRKSYIQKLNESSDFSQPMLDYLIKSNFEVLALYHSTDSTELQIGHENFTNYLLNHQITNFTIKGFFEAAGFACADLLKICSFAGKEFDCCAYMKSTITEMGKCFQLRMDPGTNQGMTQLQPGIKNGLQIIADFHTEEQLSTGKLDEAEPFFSNEFENGFRYYVHDAGAISYLSAEGISVSPGSRVYSAISPNRFILLPEDKWGNCTYEWPPGYNNSYKYSSSNCKAVCRARYFYNFCNCSPFVYNIFDEFKVCTPYATYTCIKEIEAKQKSPFVPPPCNECKMECESWEYYTYNSYGQGFSNGALKWLTKRNPNWTHPHIRANFVTINIFFRDMTFTEYIQVQSTSITELLSDIGGNMGLFVGMSCITCSEVIIFLIKISWIAFSKKRRKYMRIKKEKEEERERRLDETIGATKKNRTESMRSSLSARFLQSSQHLRKFTTMPWQWPHFPHFGHHENEENEMAKKEDRRRTEFLDHYVDSRLYGDGYAEDNVDEKSEDSDEDHRQMVELMIDMGELSRHRSSTDTRLLNAEVKCVSSSCRQRRRSATAESSSIHRNNNTPFF